MMLFWSRNFSLSFHLQVEKAVPAPLREVRAADRAALSLLSACSPPLPRPSLWHLHGGFPSRAQRPSGSRDRIPGL